MPIERYKSIEVSPTSAQMRGRVCLVTGANSGVGKETALGLARLGAHVVMVCRSRARGESAQLEIQARSGNSTVDLLLADLSSQQEILSLAGAVRQHYEHVDVLVNNAGAFYHTRRETVEGIEQTLAVNYLAPFLLTNLLLDVLATSTTTGPARVVNVSSAAHTSGRLHGDMQSRKSYRPRRAYTQAKLAVVLFTYALSRRVASNVITANCLHPGFVATNFAQDDLPAHMRLAYKLVYTLFGTPPEEGAKTSLYLASSPDVEGVTGHYFVACKPRLSAPSTYDAALQDRLWRASARLVRVSMP
ncbi:MAG: SDR family oxidoreductase [Chloroflexota bacterium]|nr:SDR family oxidoreductase [Chloroflexota bacterium]